MTARWFSSGTPNSSTNKTDRHDITDILLKMALSTIHQIKRTYTSFCSINIIESKNISLYYNTRKIFLNMEENLTYISGFTADIVISAPRYVRVNQSFELKCSSFDVPPIKMAEFLVDGTTFTYIRSHEKVCYNLLRENICNISTCHCSEDGRTYALNYKADQFIDQKNNTCKMSVVDDHISVSNTVTIDVVVGK